LNGRPSFTTLKFYHSFGYSEIKNGLVAFTVAILAIFLKKLFECPFVAFNFSIEQGKDVYIKKEACASFCYFFSG